MPTMSAPPYKDRFPWVILLVVFLVQLVLGVAFSYNQRRENFARAEENLTANFHLLQTILHMDLQNAQYQEIEPFLANWVSLYQDDVDHIDLTSENGFVIFSHERKEPSKSFIHRAATISYSYEGSATLTVRWGLTSAHLKARKAQILLVIIQAITTLTLVFFLRLASRRKKDAWMLAERARELDLANQDLNIEMEERSLIEKSLAEETEQLQVTLRSLGDGVISIDHRGTILLANPAAEEMIDCRGTECIGQPIDSVLVLKEEGSEKEFKIFGSGYLQETGTDGIDLLLDSRVKKSRFVSLGCSPITGGQVEISGWVIVLRDTSGTRRLEQEQRKNSMLEALGVLAGGIAHDFNNILMAISGNISLAQEIIQKASDNDTEVEEILSNAEKATVRASDLTRQLLTFAKGGSPILDATAIDEVVREAAEFVTHGADLHLEYNFDQDLRPVQIDRHQIGQVIQNLVINARQAMATGDRLVISGTNVMEEQDGLPKAMVRIEITDKGAGIPEADLEHIFDPYYTTKKEGSGLGLAVVHSIITRHHGRIEVRSKLGEGTTFTIILMASTGAIVEAESQNMPVLKGVGRILVMDDDQAVLLITCRMIRLLGFEVIAAEHGGQAIELYKGQMQRGEAIDLVLMDLTIPKGMGGQETIKEMLKIDPECRAIVASGYSNDPVMAHYGDYGFKASLVKPFDVRHLSQLLDKVMNQD